MSESGKNLITRRIVALLRLAHLLTTTTTTAAAAKGRGNL
jgi:hypothetical protein